MSSSQIETHEFKLLIDGELVSGESTLEVINPANEQVLAHCPRASAGQLERAVAAASGAFVGWAATPLAQRQQALCAIADTVERNSETLARLLTGEQGKPLRAATGEVLGTAAFFRHFSMCDLPPQVIEDSAVRKVTQYRRPLGVIGAIVPWNFPLMLMAFKVPPALLTGNTVVLKPAPTTPLTTLYFGELVKDILPRGVLNVITDANDLGGALTAHPDIAKISFTGSTATGRKVMAGAAATLKRVTLELGGNDAAIVLDDVQPQKVAPQLFEAAFYNSGQMCVAVKRLYVQEAIYEEMCAELAALAKRAVVGDGLATGTQFGPLQNRTQFEKVKGLIADSRRHGKLIAGGETPFAAGYFINPAIVRDIEDGTPLVDEEQFGPVLPVIRFRDPEDALARANATPFGLGQSIWSSNPERAQGLAMRSYAGTVWINKHPDMAPHIPFGGAKQSGFGAELGEEGLREFTRIQVINSAQ